MSTQVYYRKWRPRRFDQVVGQHPVTQTLRQAIARGRVAHAYLFCGPRGTGKTSTARILAKAVNCRQREPGQSEPCDQCALCVAANRNALMDMVEIDAASNRGIDEIRSLREKVHFAPTEAAYKVYIIDEVHMLTDAAFNAFLKTLEEPPGHTIFVLATTEPHKLPATVISRCQRFDFRRIALPAVVERLSQICQEEGVEADTEVLRTVSRASWGSLRDAENVLEQLVTAYGSRIGLEEVRDLLGLGGEDRAFALVKHVLTGNTTQALQAVNAVSSQGLDLRPFHRQIVDYLRAVLLIKSGARDGVEYTKDTTQELAFLASGASLERILKAVKLLGTVAFRYDNPSPLPLELAVVEASREEEREAHTPPRSREAAAPVHVPGQMEEAQRDTALASPPPPTTSAAASRGPSSAGPARDVAPAPPPEKVEEPGAPDAEPAEVGAGAASESTADVGVLADRLEQEWPALLKALSRYKGQRFNLGALLRDCRTREVKNEAIVLRFIHRSHMERIQQELEDPRCRKDFQETFQNILGTSCDIRLESAENGGAAGGGPPQGHLVRAALGMGGKIVAEQQDSKEESQDDEQEPA